jgi:hypothetical protein
MPNSRFNHKIFWNFIIRLIYNVEQEGKIIVIPSTARYQYTDICILSLIKHREHLIV